MKGLVPVAVGVVILIGVLWLAVSGYGIYPSTAPGPAGTTSHSTTVMQSTTQVLPGGSSVSTTTGVSGSSNPEFCHGVGASQCVPGPPFGPSPAPSPDQYCAWYDEYFGVGYGPSGQHCNAQTGLALVNFSAVAVGAPVVSVPWLLGLISSLGLLFFGIYRYLGD